MKVPTILNSALGDNRGKEPNGGFTTTPSVTAEFNPKLLTEVDQVSESVGGFGNGLAGE